MTKKLINYWLDKYNNVVLKYLSESNNKKEIENKEYHPYFYIFKDNLEKTKEVLKDFVFTDYYSNITYLINFNFIETNERDYKEKKSLVKVEYYINEHQLYFRRVQEMIQKVLDTNEIKHFEIDLDPGKLFILDNDIEICEKYDILYYDIESKDTSGGIEIGGDRILTISGIDNTGKKFKIGHDDEKKTLEDFLLLLQNYDIFVGWNSRGFDFPYIKSRLKVHSMFFSFKSYIHLDLMKIFMVSFAVSHSFGKRYIPSYSLQNIAKEFLKSSKLKIKAGGEGYGGRMWKLFNEDREQLLEYNLQDCVLLKELDETYNLIKNEIEITKISKAPLSQTQNINSNLDFLILRKSRKLGLRYNSVELNVEGLKYPGGYIIEPTPGIYKNVCIFDFKSLYPSIFRTFNISHDSILEKEEDNCIRTPNGYFYKKERGIFPIILDELTEMRFKYRAEQDKLKKEGKDEESYVKEFQQTAYKIVILEMYGVTGSPYSRFYDTRIASSITETGQHFLKKSKEYLDSKDFEVIYGDTDSTFVNIKDTKNIPEVQKYIDTFLNEEVKKFIGEYKNYLEMELEKILEKLIIITKKKYVGRRVWEGTLEEGKKVDELYYRGIEMHKGSEILVTKKLQEDILNAILFDEVSVEEIKKMLLKCRTRVMKKEITNSDELTISKRISRMPNQYKTIPVHVQLAIKRKEKGDLFFVGKRVPFIVMNNSPLQIIHKNDFKGEYNAKYYWENQIVKPTTRILNVVYPNENWSAYEEGSLDFQTTLI